MISRLLVQGPHFEWDGSIRSNSLSLPLTFGQIYTNNHYTCQVRKANPVKISVVNDCCTSGVIVELGKGGNAAFTQC